MGLIRIEGHKPQVLLEDVAASVINRAGKYYWKDDSTRITKIKTDTGYGYYRLESPLICFCETTRSYLLKSNCVKTRDNQWLLKSNPETIEINGHYHQKKYCISIGGKWFLKSDQNIVNCIITNNYILKSSAIALSEKYYGSAYASNTQKVKDKLVLDSTGEWILKPDSASVITKSGESVYMHYHLVDRSFLKVFGGFKNPKEPSFTNILQASADSRDIDSFVSFPGLNVMVHNTHVKVIEDVFEEYTNSVLIPRTKEILSSLTFSDAGVDENTAKVVSPDYHRYPGNQILYQPNSANIEFSKRKTLTGDIGYTFGVEIETSAGLLSNAICNKLGVTKVGDGSIGSAEYVTMPLHGDKGILKLKEIMSELANATFVDDRCAIHIHVGGADNKYVTTPNFSTDFMKNAIKLGCAIESDMYKICPTTRHPEYKHCHSIKRYEDINDNNLLHYLGMFAFGPQEQWGERMSVDDYKYGKNGITKNTTLGNYCGGRYKWLNLVNCLSKSRHETLEIRLFAGSTSFKKVYNYVLLTLGFMHAAEAMTMDKTIKIKSLSALVEFSFKNSPKLKERLLSFISTRMKKFNRTKIYSRLPIPFEFTGVKPSVIDNISHDRTTENVITDFSSFSIPGVRFRDTDTDAVNSAIDVLHTTTNNTF